MSDLSDGSFLIFGGFVNGSRINELAKFSMVNSQTIQASKIEPQSGGRCCPKPRASASSAVYMDKMYVFGGQDDDNCKLRDLWEFDTATLNWR